MKQVNEALKHIWTAEPTDKQAQQRDYVLKHLLALNRPCLFVDQVQAHSGAAMRNNSESISELLFAGIKKVIELATPAHGRPTNEQSAQSMSLETGLQASRSAATMRYEVVGNKARKAISQQYRLGLDYIYPPAVPDSSPGLAPA